MTLALNLYSALHPGEVAAWISQGAAMEVLSLGSPPNPGIYRSGNCGHKLPYLYIFTILFKIGAALAPLAAGPPPFSFLKSDGRLMTVRLNKQILGGNLAADAIVRAYDNNAKHALSFRVITSEQYRDEHGVMQEISFGHNVVMYGKAGAFDKLCAVLKTGAGVYVEGRTEHHVNESGGQSYYNTVVNASRALGGLIQLTRWATEPPQAPPLAPMPGVGAGA